MSKHVRVRSRSRTSKRVAVAAALGLLTATAAWANAVHDRPDGARPARASLDDRPTAAAAAVAAADRAGRVTHRDPLQGLTGISEATLAGIPADARQLVLVTGKAEDSSESTVTLYDRPGPGADWTPAVTWPARNGANGWSPAAEREQGDLTSPVGLFTLTDAGGLLPKPPGTRFPYDRSRLFVPTGEGVNGESLAGAFDYVVAIDFNRERGVSPLDPRQPDGEDKGGNIWLHVDHDGPSRGCVGISKEAMRTLLQTLDPAAHPVIAMGPAGF
ncbi:MULTISPECIES: L,D-transpeptidase family protein [unclassified Streptomyces]|uniref:L,D-transpeptidase family protein n=1 Tax=unclassified Streptomyces TaxID=2593676 RepID=UPI00225A4243|nr:MULTISPECIES: L,D-transpeptidase family protein [unclassified Streptomyces]MCX4526401.1 L,D-transpeptidase family protein [Streptomyces sp. NBC_01551]MCX4543036.1 L,D-transpeptidase family protein [Streptomyces sp. NBC_01565]